MHQPADIDRKLRGFRPRQQHAVVQRMQKSLLGNPASSFDQFGVHQRDLSGRSAKADAAQFDPVPEGFFEGDGGWCWCGGEIIHEIRKSLFCNRVGPGRSGTPSGFQIESSSKSDKQQKRNRGSFFVASINVIRNDRAGDAD